MAVVINKNYLEQVSSSLMIQPQIYNRGKMVEDGDSVVCYKLRDSDLLIPFTYAVKNLALSNDKKEYPHSSFKSNIVLFERQKGPINEIIEMINRKRTCVVRLRTGFGKTRLSCQLTSMNNYYVCVLVPIVKLGVQWAGTFRTHTEASVWIVDDEVQHQEQPNVIISYISSARLSKIPAEWKDRIGILLIDECHMFNNPTGANALLEFQPKYTVGLSATPNRSRDQMHRVMELFLGDEVVTRPMDVNFTVVRISTGIKATREPGYKGRPNWTVLNQSLLYSDERNQLIVQLASHYLNSGKKIMIMTTETNHVTLLFEMIQAAGLDSDYRTGKKHTYRDSRILIANTQSTGTGFDEEMACSTPIVDRIDTIILVASFKNPELLEQTVGRAFRVPEPLIVHLVDKDSIIESHWSIARHWYLNNGGTIAGSGLPI